MKPPIVVAVLGLIFISLLNSWPVDNPKSTVDGVFIRDSSNVTVTFNGVSGSEQLDPVIDSEIVGVERVATNPETHTDKTVSTNPGLAQPPQSQISPQDLVSHIIPIIQKHEGYSEEPYVLNGLPHVCWGHQLQNPEPMENEQCKVLLAEDTALSVAVARDFAEPVWEELTVGQQGVLTELAYTLGRQGLNSFNELRKAVWRKDWEQAQNEIQNSLLPDDSQLGQKRVDSLKSRLK